MRHRRFSVLPAVLLVAGTFVPPQEVLGSGHSTGSDFVKEVGGFQLVELQGERVCRLPTGVPHTLKAPLLPATPPPAPFDGAVFDFALVLQRHGSRRSMLGDSTSTAYYGNTKPGQLLHQGYYELHVAGIETRDYLIRALHSWRGPDENSCRSLGPEATYRRTLGLELGEDCRTAGLDPSVCTLSNLVYSLGKQIPTEAVYARSSALPRTQWSGLAFLQGFYGLPFECAGTLEELDKTAGGRTQDVCLRRSACDFPKGALESAETLQEHCTSRRLPCVQAPPVEEDGFMCAATVSTKSYADASRHYHSKGVRRSYEPEEPHIQQALDIATKVYGQKVLGKGSPWMAGEMAFSEISAGAKVPLAALAQWVERRKRRCAHPASKCKPDSVPKYESLLEDLLTAYRLGTNVQYADGEFSRFAVSPFIAIQNALFRVKAFNRDKDRIHLQEMMNVVGGFENHQQDEAIHKLKMMLLSFHDFMLLGLMELLDVQKSVVLPFAARITVELSHSETAVQDQDVSKESDQGRGCESRTDSWPESSYVVRVLMGVPGEQTEAVELPWCGNVTVCPLHKWLSYTTEKLRGHWFYDVAVDFHQKYIEARSHLADGSGLFRR